jgi:hypothetical protein
METIDSEACESSTPILDRLAPLPLPDKRINGPKLLMVAVIAMAGEVIAVLIVSCSPALQRLIWVPIAQWLDEPWTGARIVSVCLSSFIAVVATVLIHEVGHVLGGLATGFRFLSLRVGPLVFERSFRISWYRGPGAASSGLARMMPGKRDNLRLRALVFIVAGPGANLLSAGLVFALPTAKGFSSTALLIVSVVTFVGSFVPFRSPVGLSDGSRIWMLWRNHGAGERWLALMKIEAESQEGVLTEKGLAEHIAKAIAVRDPSPETVLAHAFAFSAAINRRQDHEAGELLETCLRYSSYAPPSQRDGLISDAAVFQARLCKRADLAAQWLADLQSTPIPRLRVRAEAAVLEAQGDTAGALSKLDEYEAALLSLPNRAQREMLLRGLSTWRCELQPPDAAAAPGRST